MSTISNRHSVVPFISGKSEPLTGQRLARILYKPRGKNPAAYPSVCVSVPPVKFDEVRAHTERLMPAMMRLVEDTQDKILKSLYEAREGHLQSVSDDEIGMDAVISFLESELNGGRITGAAIDSWFTEQIADSLTVLVSEKTQSEDMEILNGYVQNYKKMFTALASPRTSYGLTQVNGLLRVLEVCDSASDGIGATLAQKLEQMKKPVMTAELLEL